jgi:hypothetical protein
MADYEKDLGTIESLLQKVLSELEGIKSKLSPELSNLIWYDNLPSYSDMRSGRALPKKNAADRRNISVLGCTEVTHFFDECGFNYEVKPLKRWHDKYSDRNNLYFVEITQVHLGLERFFEFIPPEALQLCRENKLAFVWFFPHEAFHLEGLRETVPGRSGDAGWFERFTDEFYKFDIDCGRHYFIFGDIRVENSWTEWVTERPEKSNLFKKVFGLDYFNHHYFLQYTSRTQLKFDSDTTILPIENYETYGYLPEAKVRNVFVEPYSLFDNFGDIIEIQDDADAQHIKSQEVLKSVPKPEQKTKDLICFNARVRPHRSVMVSELFRLGYDNDNSHISWLERDQEHMQGSWQSRCFKELWDVDGKEQWVKSNNAWGELMSTQESKEYFYDFWERNDGPIICDSKTEEIDVDDRSIPLDMFKESFFFLITETLFGNKDKDCLQITEKTYKGIAYRIPFIVVGSYGTLEHLRTIGYKSFPHMFDESYDEIPEPDKRMSAICDELEKWRMLPLEEKRDRYRRTMPAIMHNYAHYKESSPARVAEFRNIFDRLKLHD